MVSTTSASSSRCHSYFLCTSLVITTHNYLFLLLHIRCGCYQSVLFSNQKMAECDDFLYAIVVLCYSISRCRGKVSWFLFDVNSFFHWNVKPKETFPCIFYFLCHPSIFIFVLIVSESTQLLLLFCFALSCVQLFSTDSLLPLLRSFQSLCVSVLSFFYLTSSRSLFFLFYNPSKQFLLQHRRSITDIDIQSILTRFTAAVKM